MIGKLLARSRYWHRQTLVIIIIRVGRLDMLRGTVFWSSFVFVVVFFFGFSKNGVYIGGGSGRETSLCAVFWRIERQNTYLNASYVQAAKPSMRWKRQHDDSSHMCLF